MKLCIYGTGAIGGHLAARLMKTGTHEVSVIARNQQLQAIERDGLTLQSGEESLTVRPRQVTDRPETLPPQDVVFVTLKAPAQAAAAS
ncbi:MAG: 2-dehydropantoate 2-reductase N-terminal domain-containing protein, partial [Burkholderiaceae bacterium]